MKAEFNFIFIISNDLLLVWGKSFDEYKQSSNF